MQKNLMLYFDQEGFADHVKELSPGVFSGEHGSFTREWLENTVKYGYETYFHGVHGYDRFEAFLISVIPEIQSSDVRPFYREVRNG